MLARVILVLLGCSTVVMAADPALARREFARSVLAKSRGESAQAASFEEAARMADPTSMLLVTRSAKRALHDGDMKKASTLYRELAQACPDSIRAQLLYADFLRAQGKDDDFALSLALTTLEKIQTQHPADPTILERMLRIFEQQGKREKSEALYQEYMKNPAADPAVAEMFTRILHDSDDMKSRADLDRLYREQSAQQPTNPEVARAASDHFRKVGAMEEAIAILTAHTTAVPSSLDLRVRLGIFQLAADQAKAGEKTLLAVLEIAPTQFLAHQALAKLYTKLQKPDLARKHRSELLKIRGGEVGEFRELGQELLDVGEVQQARILLEKAIFYYPETISLAYLVAIATHLDPTQKGKAAELFRAAEKLEKTPQQNPYFLRMTAEAYWADQKPALAEEKIRQAIKLYPAASKKESAEALRMLASWWQQQDKNVEAAKALLQRAEMLER